MPKYRVLERSYINGRLTEPGATVEFSGNAGPNLEPIDDAAKKAQAAYQAKVGKATSPNDPEFPLELAKAISSGASAN